MATSLKTLMSLEERLLDLVNPELKVKPCAMYTAGKSTQEIELQKLIDEGKLPIGANADDAFFIQMKFVKPPVRDSLGQVIDGARYVHNNELVKKDD
jgi:hypothetical protein